jgi:DUF2892 family protein
VLAPFSLHPFIAKAGVLPKRLLVQRFDHFFSTIVPGMPLARSSTYINQGGAVMTYNVGGIERPIRIMVGILVIAIGAFAGLPPLGTGMALVLGTIALLTGAIGYCPLWTLFGMNTCPTETPRKP